MLHHFIDPLLQIIKDTVAHWGYLGVIVMMAIESANIPLPSEAVMPTAGILVHEGKMNLHLAALSGALGCLLGSIPSYFLGLYGGRPFFEKYGRYLLMKPKDLELADTWVDRYGDATFFLCRILPVVRTFISFPAGMLKAHFSIFCLFTFLGSLAWCYFLTYIGIRFGENMQFIIEIWHKFDLVIVLFIALALAYYLYHHLRAD